ncbi:MAG: 30S ribosomal protein S17 [Candidatus Moranbacteria bacterium]|nr:30S ribosomal protein S17 [Candidatus Moranbacteria bacterium]
MDKIKKNSSAGKKKATDKKVILVKKTGYVVSDKNDKTIIVEVTVLKTHSVYIKKYRKSKRYKVHDEKNEYKVGDQATIVQCKPISKDKTWKVMEMEK